MTKGRMWGGFGKKKGWEKEKENAAEIPAAF